MVRGDMIMKRPILTTIFLSLFLCSQAVADDRVLHLNMDEASGNLTDLSGYGNNCTPIGSPTYSQTGAPNRGTAIYFPTTASYFSCGTDSSILPDVFTAMGWIKTTKILISMPMFRFSASGYPILTTYHNTAGALIQLGPSNYQYFSTTVANDGNWHHVAFVVTGNGQNDIDNALFFLDGRSITKGTKVKTGSPDIKTALYIARNTVSMEITLDDLKIYNYVLSAIQIQHEYQQSRLAISRKHEPWKWADLLNLAFIMKGDQLYEKNQRISYLRQHPIN